MSRLSTPLLRCLAIGVTTASLLVGDIGYSRSDDTTPTFVLPPVDEFWAIVERPLFTRSRRPSDAISDSTAQSPNSEEADQPTAQIMLVGTATDQGVRAVAVLRSTTEGAQFRVWVGDSVGGWIVKAIKPRAIVLGADSEEISVTLDEPIVPEASTPR